MLTELTIRNFAIIDDISVTFHDGLTVLTGETGAGKSIIIDAVQLLAGERASVHYVRHGEKKAEITGLFSLEDADKTVFTLAKAHDIDVTDNMLILERIITKQGKSICKINHKMVTLSVLKQFGEKIVNIHSQHDTVQLMDHTTHIQLLDAFDEANILPIKDEYDAIYTKYIDLQKQFRASQMDEQEMAHRLDFIQFQLHELTEADVQLNEDEILEEERQKLQHYEKLFYALDQAYHALSGESKALELVHIAQNQLQEVASFDDTVAENAEQLTSLYYQLEEQSFSLRQNLDGLHYDEARLNEIESRLNEINHLKKKYGLSIEAMYAYKAEIEAEIATLLDHDSHIEQLKQSLSTLEEEALEIAAKLSQQRQRAANRLEKQIESELNDLHLEQATFSVNFAIDERTVIGPNGTDSIMFMISTNIGEPLQPLSKVASGGELSRIMLALNNIFSKHNHIQTVIFDEIDTGVSGRVAQSIAEKMYEISTITQVLCITHLPQVAAMSDHHFRIQKQEMNDRTVTSVQDLCKTDIIKEIGKMLTGTELTDTAIEHAEQLLALTNDFKKKVNETVS
ncbi:MAG TPA: DNA repair protein RecN [Pseudogracilibacillus sp.]|nr:DNA repair protein RecN [Pseudogracilibacillus sp.]